MSWKTLATAVLATLVLQEPDEGAEPGAAAGSPIVLTRCSLEFEKTTLLGASQPGVVFEVLVKAGDRVKAGQVLGRLFDAELKAELALRRAEAENDTDIRLGEAKLALAQSKLRASQTLSRRNLISAEELTEHKLDAQAAELEIEAARHKVRIAVLTSRQVEAMIQAREFVSPHDGIVVTVLKNKGESVGPNEPVLRLVDPDTVRVTGYLDVGDAWQAHAGQLVNVNPEILGVELPIEQKVFNGRIEYVDAEINLENQTCKVVAIVQNRGGVLRAGLEARMEIVPDDEPLRSSDTRRSPSTLKR